MAPVSTLPARTSNPADARESETVVRVRCVLDLINTDKSAVELLEHRVAQITATKRYRNEIYCGPGPYADRLRSQGFTVHTVDQPRMLRLIPLLRATWRTYRLLRRGRFNVIHTHGSVVGWIGRMAGFGLGLMFMAGYALQLSHLTLMMVLGLLLLNLDRKRLAAPAREGVEMPVVAMPATTLAGERV